MLAGKQNFFIVILSLSCFFFHKNSWAQFAPGPQSPFTTAISLDDENISFWANDITLHRSWQNIADTSLGLTTIGDGIDALGKANQTFVSLGDGGWAVLRFPFAIYNEIGYDFAVFENGFAQANANENEYFIELAQVAVSQNGIDYISFPNHSLTPTESQIGSFETLNCTNFNNLAGKYPHPYGTPFDLEDLGLDSIISIKIIDVIGTIDTNYCTYDAFGNIINDPFPTPFPSSGFDLNAIAALNQKNVIIDTSTAILFLEEGNLDFSFFPNPIKVGDKLNINFTEKGDVKIGIYNALGKQIIKTITNSNFQFSTENLEHGLYFLHLSTGKRTESVKFIVY